MSRPIELAIALAPQRSADRFLPLLRRSLLNPPTAIRGAYTALLTASRRGGETEFFFNGKGNAVLPDLYPDLARARRCRNLFFAAGLPTAASVLPDSFSTGESLPEILIDTAADLPFGDSLNTARILLFISDSPGGGDMLRADDFYRDLAVKLTRRAIRVFASLPDGALARHLAAVPLSQIELTPPGNGLSRVDFAGLLEQVARMVPAWSLPLRDELPSRRGLLGQAGLGKSKVPLPIPVRHDEEPQSAESAPKPTQATALTSAAEAELIERVRAFPVLQNLDQIAEALRRVASDPAARAFALYLWITLNIEYDAACYLEGKETHYDAPGVVETRRTVCSGYARLYVALAEKLGLQAVEVVGYAKGYGFAQGDRMSSTNHAWNAVKIGSGWCLLDSCWGAGALDGRRFKKHFSRFWFGTPPSLMRLSHLPEEPRWQLASPALSLSEFKRTSLSGESLLSIPDLFDMGFHEAALLESAAMNELPRCFAVDSAEVHQINAPHRYTLEAGRSLTLRFAGSNVGAMAVHNNGEHRDLKRDGNEFYGRLLLQPGPLQILVQQPRLQSLFGLMGAWSVLIEYDVV